MQDNQNHAQVILALDIGGTMIKSALFGDGQLIRQLPQIASNANKSATEIAAALQCAVAAAGRIDGIGIAIPGPFDYPNGISWMDHKFGAIKGRSLREFLPALPVRFIHDANAFLLGESRYGAVPRGLARVAGITLGTGIGAALMIDGTLQSNALGSPSEAVSLWSKSYRGGTVEDAISTRALLKKSGVPDGKTLAETAKNNDATSLRVWHEYGDDLAEILRAWHDRLQPEFIVIGGQLSKDHMLFDHALRSLPVGYTKCGEKAALYGAASLWGND